MQSVPLSRFLCSIKCSPYTLDLCVEINAVRTPSKTVPAINAVRTALNAGRIDRTLLDFCAENKAPRFLCPLKSLQQAFLKIVPTLSLFSNLCSLSLFFSQENGK